MKDKQFIPKWKKCLGMFNGTDTLTSQENEQAHYRKHVELGKEWSDTMTLKEYRERAKKLLNSRKKSEVVEFCQVEDLAVVKCNLSTGELGIAKRDNGRIKTFFRPGLNYVYRKLDSAQWGEPGIQDGFIDIGNTVGFDDDPEKEYLYRKLELLSISVPSLAENTVLLRTKTKTLPQTETIELLSGIGELRYYIYEIKQRILTEEQRTKVLQIHKECIRAEAAMEAIEKSHMIQTSTQITDILLKTFEDMQVILKESELYISSKEDLEDIVGKREKIGFALLGIRLFQIMNMIQGVQIKEIEFELKKRDLYFRKTFFKLALKYEYDSDALVYPEEFFWRKKRKK